MAIRYTSDYNRQIRQIVRSYNRKLARIKPQLQKQGVALLENLQPVTTAELKSEYQSRYYLNRRLKEMQRFIKRGSERISTKPTKAPLTQYQYESLRRQQAAAKRAYTIRLKNFQVKGPVDRNFGLATDPAYQRLQAKREALNVNIEFLSEKELRALSTTAAGIYNRGIKRQQFFSDYLQTLYDMGKMYNYPKEKLDYIMQRFSDISAGQFEATYQEDPVLGIIMDNYHGLSTARSDGPEADPQQVLTALDTIYENFTLPQ